MENIATISDSIIELLNTLFSSLFSSIDSNLYFILDELIFISNKIFEDALLDKFLSNSMDNSLIIICNALMAGILIYYCFSNLLSHIAYFKTQPFHFFIFRIIICTILMNFSFTICENIVNLVDIVSLSILDLGKFHFENDINFSSFIELTSNYAFDENFSLFSFNGILQSFYSFGFINLLISYSLRYILVRLLILLSPFAFIALSIDRFSSFFNNWIKSFIGLLFIQIIVALILILGFSLDFAYNTILNQILFLGIIFAISKANQITIDLIGGINTSINSTFNSVFKNN